jgi:FkbM family methyltransferase
VRSSFLYDLYWKAADPSLLQKREEEINFFRRTLVGLGKSNLIFDIGANHGYKSDIFLRLGARVVAVDPDPANHEILRQRFRTYRLQEKPITIVGKALSDHKGVETMWVDEPGSAKNTLNVKWVETLREDATRFGSTLQFGKETKVETTTVEQLIATYGRPFYIKIDVEGYEATVLRGLRSPVRYISFEVNLPEFKPEALECIELLENVAAQGDLNYAPDCRRGLALERWLPQKEFISVLNDCQEPCIEVFWRAPVSHARGK